MTGNQEYDWSGGDPEYDAVFAQERAVGDVAETILLALEERGLRMADLADLCGVTRSAISQRLDGRSNMTVRTVAETLHKLGYGIQFQLVDDRNHNRVLGIRDYEQEARNAFGPAKITFLSDYRRSKPEASSWDDMLQAVRSR